MPKLSEDHLRQVTRIPGEGKPSGGQAQTYKVLRPFVLDEKSYKPGDEFAMPSGWERIENHPTLHQDQQTLFGYRVQVGFSTDAKTGKGRAPEYADHTAILPVAESV